MLSCYSDTGVWTKATTNGEGPSPRFSLAGDCAEPDKGILLFIGGCNENLEALDDMYYLDTGTARLLNFSQEKMCPNSASVLSSCSTWYMA